MVTLRAMLMVQFSSKPMKEGAKHRLQGSRALETDRTNMILQCDLLTQQQQYNSTHHHVCDCAVAMNGKDTTPLPDTSIVNV